jgi:hypothetical protein
MLKLLIKNGCSDSLPFLPDSLQLIVSKFFVTASKTILILLFKSIICQKKWHDINYLLSRRELSSTNDHPNIGRLNFIKFENLIFDDKDHPPLKSDRCKTLKIFFPNSPYHRKLSVDRYSNKAKPHQSQKIEI